MSSLPLNPTLKTEMYWPTGQLNFNFLFLPVFSRMPGKDFAQDELSQYITSEKIQIPMLEHNDVSNDQSSIICFLCFHVILIHLGYCEPIHYL